LDSTVLGVDIKTELEFLKTKKEEYTLFQSIPVGVSTAINTLSSYIKQFKLLATKEGAKQMGGFLTIGSIFPKTWDWLRFWNRTAFLSIILAFMNILPIPALDGGYILFILVEMITGKKPGDKFLTRANTIGFAILILLLLYANGMDIFRFFMK
jgi:regulator of sigma E protease